MIYWLMIKLYQRIIRSRSGVTTDNDWISHIVGYYNDGMKYDIEGYLKRQGFEMRK